MTGIWADACVSGKHKKKSLINICFEINSF